MYYIYAFLRLDGSPYYIGKGKGNRYKAKHGHIYVPPQERIVFMETNLTNVGACALERRYIRWYGKKMDGTGILRNMADGGEGNTAPRSKEWCENHSKMMTGRKPTAETIQKLKQIDRSYMQTPEYKAKISEAAKGRPCPDASRAASSKPCTLNGVSYPSRAEASKQLGLSPYKIKVLLRREAGIETPKKPRQIDMSYTQTPEFRAKISEANRGRKCPDAARAASSKPCTLNGVSYPSRAEASKQLGLSPYKIKVLLKQGV